MSAFTASSPVQTASDVAFACIRISTGTRLSGRVLDGLCLRSHSDPGAYAILTQAGALGLLP